jgi:hypothetical protein
MFIRNCIRSNIIKRTFNHHRDLIKFPVSSFINHFDREKMEETNKNVNELVSKINQINFKINKMNDENTYMDKYFIANFVLVNGIYMPLLFFYLCF